MTKPSSKHQIKTMETFIEERSSPEQRQELDGRKRTKSRRLEIIRLEKEHIRLKKETERLEKLHAELLSRSLCSRCKGQSPCIEDAPPQQQVQNLASRSAHPSSSSHMPSHK